MLPLAVEVVLPAHHGEEPPPPAAAMPSPIGAILAPLEAIPPPDEAIPPPAAAGINARGYGEMDDGELGGDEEEHGVSLQEFIYL